MNEIDRETELYRIETPFDAIGAVAVARCRPEPGLKVLLISREKSGAPREVEGAVRALAAAYPWSAILDVSDLPMNVSGPAGRRERMARLEASRRYLDERLDAVAGGPVKVTAVGITCIAHPDHQILFDHYARAQKLLLIHNSCNFSEHEHTFYSRFLDPTHRPSLTGQVVLSLKRLLFGRRSALSLKYRIDHAYFLRRPFAWAGENTQLDELLRPEGIGDFLRFLPPGAQASLERCRRAGGDRPGLLLLPPEDVDLPENAEIQAGIDLVSHIAEGGARAVFVKPHPMSTPDWNRRNLSALRDAWPAVRFIELGELDYVPVEILAHSLGVGRCGTVNSSAIWFLRTVLGIDCYYPKDAIARMSAVARESKWPASLRLRTVQEWETEYQSVYTSV